MAKKKKEAQVYKCYENVYWVTRKGEKQLFMTSKYIYNYTVVN